VDAPVFVAQGEGRRTDVEVKPYGSDTVYKPQQQYQSYSQQSSTSVPALEQLKNPLVATALGITLALMLLSLSHLPKMVGSWFHHKDHHDQSLMRQDYNTYDRGYQRHPMDRQDSMYQNARDSVYHAKDRAEDMYYHAKDAVLPRESMWSRWTHRHPQQSRYQQDEEEEHRETMWQRARHAMPFSGYRSRQQQHHEEESLLQRARDMMPSARHQESRESLLQRARDAVGMGGEGSYSSNSYLDEARRGACRTAERARDIACDFSGSSSYGSSGPSLMDRGRDAVDSARYHARDAVDSARHQARDASYRAQHYNDETVAQKAQSLYEQAKQRAADMVESVKDTVTYPLQAAKDTVQDTQGRARETVGATTQAAKDSAYNAKEAVKGTVQGAGDAVKNAATGVKDAVVGAGQAVKDKLTPSQDDHADININNGGRGPTKIKVEVQEL
jgi:hypothetical protein